jgi:DNA invertase Pin-like site-specific DNA recombinase
MDKKTLARLDEALKAATKAVRILDEEGFDTCGGVYDAIDALRDAGARFRRNSSRTRTQPGRQTRTLESAGASA